MTQQQGSGGGERETEESGRHTDRNRKTERESVCESQFCDREGSEFRERRAADILAQSLDVGNLFIHSQCWHLIREFSWKG